MRDLKKELQIYLDNNLIHETPIKKSLFSNLFSFFEEDSCDTDFQSINSSNDAPILSKQKNISINDFIKKHEQDNDFQTLLFKLIDERNLKDSDVYNKVHINRRLFSKIRSDSNYHPSKETIILLALSLELTESELDDLLESASYSLPKNNKYDLIIRFCFINKIFKLTEVNELLDDYNCKLLIS